MNVLDATIESEGLKELFKSVSKATINFKKKTANNPARALVIAIKVGSSAATKNPRAALAATPELIKRCETTGKRLKIAPKGRGLSLGTKKSY